MNILKGIIYSGLQNSYPYHQKRGIVIANNVSLLLCITVIALFYIRFVPFLPGTKIISWEDMLKGVVALSIPILMNRMSWTTWSRIYLCLGSMGFVWYVHVSRMIEVDVVQTSLYGSLAMFLLSLSAMPFLLFDKNRLAILLSLVVVTLLSYWYFEEILGLMGVSHAQKGIPGEDYLLLKLRIFVAYLIIGGGSYIFQRIINQSDDMNQKILSKLKAKTDEIEAHNEELKISQESLNEINQNLEELVAKKTVNIVLQNKKLLEYAHINAHHVRGPLARILGLLLLASMENNVDYQMFLNKIECEITEIEGVFESISKELDGSEYMISKGFS